MKNENETTVITKTKENHIIDHKNELFNYSYKFISKLDIPIEKIIEIITDKMILNAMEKEGIVYSKVGPLTSIKKSLDNTSTSKYKIFYFVKYYGNEKNRCKVKIREFERIYINE